MKYLKIISILAIVSLISFSSLLAQGRGYNNQNRNYDINTVETIKGEVLSTSTQKGNGRSIGLHAVIKTENGEVPVHVGPVWYLEDISLNLQKGDEIEVVGSRIDYEGESTIIAAKISRGDKTFDLRRENGIPNWAGNQGRKVNKN